jgi:hypothetical protein
MPTPVRAFGVFGLAMLFPVVLLFMVLFLVVLLLGGRITRTGGAFAWRR